MPGVIDPNAPADRKPTLKSKIVAAVTPAPKAAPATKVVSYADLMKNDPEDIKIIQSALVDIVGAKFAPNGKWGPQTAEAYKKWQMSLGFKGKDADGKPGRQSLTKLGEKYGFKVV
jgi:peptidoglycan hydrolase-like protein with peptidoglycan-binding domain